MKTPPDKDLVREFNITPDHKIYDLYFNSAKFFLTMTYSNEYKKFNRETDPKKRAQAWQYVKAMIQILRERGFWVESECKPLDTKDKVIKYPTTVEEETFTCPKCLIDLKLSELIRGHCPMGCGNIFKMLEEKEDEEARAAEILQVGIF